MSRPIVWTLAGSDSGGGAGIQADLHTFQSLNVHGCSVITTVTAQNSQTTADLFALSGESIVAQCHCLLADLPPLAIKIGLLSNVEQVRVITTFLAEWPASVPRPFVVWDPVMISTQQDRLSSLSASDCHELLREVDLVTPNADELNWLLGCDREYANVAESFSQLHSQTGLSALLVTGVKNQAPEGTPEVQDVYIDNKDEWQMVQCQVATPHQHGTGCTLSSAIAACVAKGFLVSDALVLASAYVNRGLHQARAVGRGPGPVAHTGWPRGLRHFPELRSRNLPPASCSFAPLWHRPGLYPVVDCIELLEELLILGVCTVQLRKKACSGEELVQAVRRAVMLGKKHNAQVFINDHWQLALECGAYGVHLGQEDLQRADLNAISKAGLRLGISTHSYTELLIAYRYRPSYIALGHIFPTQTKQMPSQPQGLKRLQHYVSLLASTGIDTVAIGGISEDKVAAVLGTGVKGIAMVSAIIRSNNIPLTVRRLLRHVEPEYA